MTFEHVYACPLRWGDLDMLGHTNNVRYLDYVQEARLELLHAAGLGISDDEQVIVTRHDVSFVAPLMFREDPVRVQSVVIDVTAATIVLEHVVLDQPGQGAAPSDAAEPIIYFRARTQVCVTDAATGSPRRLSAREVAGLDRLRGAPGPHSLPEDVPDGVVPQRSETYPVRVRWSDVDGYGHVSNVVHVEYLQEARLRMLGLQRWTGHGSDQTTEEGFDNLLVVAATSLRYDAPVSFRLEPYAVHSWVSRIGGASFDVDSVVVDPAVPGFGPRVLARGRVTLVGFDADTQRSAALTEQSRRALERLHA